MNIFNFASLVACAFNLYYPYVIRFILGENFEGFFVCLNYKNGFLHY